MDRSEISKIISGDDQELSAAFDSFLNKNNQVVLFPSLNLELRKNLWIAIFKHLDHEKYYIQCLSAIRILSRDKEYLDDLLDEERVEKLLLRANLKADPTDNDQADNKVTLEALKCLCNLVFNCKTVQKICEENDAAENIFKRLLSYRDLDNLDEVKFFDMKLLFLITAFSTNVRLRLKDNLNGVIYLTEYLAFILNQPLDNNAKNNKSSLSDDEVNLVCEILKVLFNLTIHNEFNSEDDDDGSMRLTAVVHDYLFVTTSSPTKQLELQTHIINLLTTVPMGCLKELITLVPKGCQISEEMKFEGYNMEPVYILLTYLKGKFENDTSSVRQQEPLLPILTVLLKLSKSSRVCRKYLRRNILPPLRDVHNRPEQGNTLRNNLCRLLTTPVTQVRDLVADMLFILCKENVARMIKYTGYGNAAGLFANRGLLGKSTADFPNCNDSKYSSDSEDSDTEEYREYKHSINPVVGCYEPPHPNPTAGMSEEQKEYEAMKLVELMDNLTRRGVVQPCRIGEDGKPEPITHVLQLQEGLNGKKET